MNQGGDRTEKLWFYFTPDRVHWASYLCHQWCLGGCQNFVDRWCGESQVGLPLIAQCPIQLPG
jgi:hypothetical protein